MTDFDVVVGDPWSLDMDGLLQLFDRWLMGITAQQAAVERIRNMRALTEHRLELLSAFPHFGTLDETGAPAPISPASAAGVTDRLREAKQQASQVFKGENMELVNLFNRDTQDYWRFFEILDHFLRQPDLIDGQVMCRVPLPTLLVMVESYYALDEAVVRELLSRVKVAGGGHSTTRNRGALDEAASICRQSFKFVQRQYMNLRCVYEKFEENRNGFNHYVFRRIQEWWRLPAELAARYTALLFLFHHGFKITHASESTFSSSSSS